MVVHLGSPPGQSCVVPTRNETGCWQAGLVCLTLEVRKHFALFCLLRSKNVLLNHSRCPFSDISSRFFLQQVEFGQINFKFRKCHSLPFLLYNTTFKSPVNVFHFYSFPLNSYVSQIYKQGNKFLWSFGPILYFSRLLIHLCAFSNRK